MSVVEPEHSRDWKAISALHSGIHAGALPWQTDVRHPISIIWLPRSAEVNEENLDNVKEYLSERSFRRIKASFANPHLRRRAECAVMDRIGMRLALQDIVTRLTT